MNVEMVEKIADAVLYEGYLLYPYRASAIKNQQRWNFGVVFSPGRIEPSHMQTECLVTTQADSRVSVRVRFLQLVERFDGPAAAGWQEAVERSVRIVVRPGGRARRRSFEYPEETEYSGEVVRRRFAIRGEVFVETEEIEKNVFRVRVRIENFSNPGKGMLHALVSAHTILCVTKGKFLSIFDPPEKFREVVSRLSNIGTWPVLAGEEGSRDGMLSSPIILYDYPKIAPESPGSLFDGTEIDEILTLRILTMTDEEKREMRESDARAREILERSEALGPEEMNQLHGVMRRPAPKKLPVSRGDAVILRPRAGADIFDLALAGKTARIESIEEDYEGQVHVAVVVDDDPGADLGMLRQPGHRFFFRLDEVEAVKA